MVRSPPPRISKENASGDDDGNCGLLGDSFRFQFFSGRPESLLDNSRLRLTFQLEKRKTRFYALLRQRQ